MKTIVVGYDDSEPARRAVERAADLASAFGAKVVVSSVASAIHGRGIGPVDPVDPPELHREQLRHAEAILAERGIDAELDLALGDPASHLVHVADERQADLVVVGTRGMHLAERLLGASVSGKVARKAHCDVLVVH